MAYPQHRFRRLRRNAALRRLVAETRISPADLIAPVFVREGIESPRAIGALPGHFQHTLASLTAEVAELKDLGISAFLLFGIPKEKDSKGSQAWAADGIAQVALAELRAEFGDEIVLIADLCLDEYTDHGHCGVLDAEGQPDNDATLVLYADVALAQATAGADIVAPSGMMDGQVAAIRAALDKHHHTQTAIMSYAAKYATALYGPFREAVDVTIAGGGDRRGYQQDMANAREAMAEIGQDIEEGADILMIKPALPSLDIIAKARSETNVPIAAYQVSGEYAMVHAAAERGWLDLPEVAREQALVIKRAGADMICTYFARLLAEMLA